MSTPVRRVVSGSPGEVSVGAGHDAARELIAHARRRARRKEAATALAFLAPTLVVFVGFLVVPIVWLVRQSFMEGGVLGPASWVGLENWRKAFGDAETVHTLKNTLRFTVMYVPLTVVLAVVVAALLRQVGRGGSVVRGIVYLPAIAPLVLVATMWFFLVHPEMGLLSAGTRELGLGTPNWLGDPSLAMPTIVSLELWRGLGFWAILVLAAMLGVPGELYQAARIDGASPLRRFVHVTWPGIRPTLLVVVLLSTVGAMQVFDSVFVLTAGGPAGATRTIGMFIYNAIFLDSNPGVGAALSVLLLVAVVVLTVVLLRVAGPRKRGRAA